MQVELGEDGITRVYFRQSWINNFLSCPEQARRDMLGLMVRKESDALSIGTAVHSGIEYAIQCGPDWDEAVRVALATFDDLAADPSFMWQNCKTLPTAHKYIVNCLATFFGDIYPIIGTADSVEEHFNRLLATRDGVELYIKGTWDYGNTDGDMWDWKTSGRRYEEWEYKRWAIQPTAYLFGRHGWDEPIGNFYYAVMVKGAEPQDAQIVPIVRTHDHFEWLASQCWDMYDLYMATDQGRKPWPKIDQSWKCSPKWCGAWSDCKGKLMGDQPW